MRLLRRTDLVGLLALAVTVVAAAVLLAATPALAADGDARDAGVAATVRTGGAVLNVRPEPDTGARRVGWVADGSALTLVCQEPGRTVDGRERRTELWDRLPDGGYVSDAYVHRTGTPPSCAAHDAAVAKAKKEAAARRAAAKAAAEAPRWSLPVPDVAGSGFRTKQRPRHDGTDFPAARHTPVRALAAGTVTVAACDRATAKCDVDGSLRVAGYGWYVDIQHADGVVSRYAHLVRRPEVRAGDRVVAGEVIGRVGSSGNSTGPHLHFEVHTATPAHRGNAVDPVTFLRHVGLNVG